MARDREKILSAVRENEKKRLESGKSAVDVFAESGTYDSYMPAQSSSFTSNSAISAIKNAQNKLSTGSRNTSAFDVAPKPITLNSDVEAYRKQMFDNYQVQQKKQAEEREAIRDKYSNLSKDTMSDISLVSQGREADKMTTGLTGAFVGISSMANKSNAFSDARMTVESGNQAYNRLLESGYSAKEVEQWVKMYSLKEAEDFNKRIEDDSKELAEKHPVLASAGTVALNVATAPVAAASIIDDAARGEIDTNNKMLMPVKASKTIRSTISEDIAEDSKAGAWLYNVGMSGADSLVASWIPGGTAFLATNAAVDTTIDLTERGVDSKKALVGGIAAGAFEAIFESISIGRFKALQEVSPKGVKDIVRNLANSIAVNASEETLTEAANIVYDTIAHGDLSNYNLMVENLKSQGMKEPQAKKEAVKALVGQVLEAGAAGAVMGGAFTAIGTPIGYARNASTAKSIGSQIKNAGEADAIIAEGLAAPKGTAPYLAAQQAKKKSDKGKSVDRALGVTAMEIGNYISDNTFDTKGRFANASTIDEVGEIYESQKRMYEEASMTPAQRKGALRQLEAEHREAVDNLYYSGISGVAEMREAGKAATTSPEAIVKTKMPTIGRNEDGDAVSVSEITDISDGVITVKTSDGGSQELDIKDVKGINAQELWTSAAEMFTDVSSAQAFIDNYNGGSVQEYSKAFSDYYHLAATGMSLEQIQETDFLRVGELSETAQIAAVEAGKKAMSFKVGVVDLTTRAKTKAENLQMNILNNVGNHIGMNIVIVDTLEQYEGFQRVGSNQIVVALDSSRGAITRTASHETWHYAKQELGDGVKHISDFVIDTLRKNKGSKWVNRRLKEYEKQGYKTKEAQIDELVADSLFDAFTNERAVKEFASKNGSVLKKISDHIKQLVADIKNILNKLVATGSYAEIKAWQSDLESLEKLNNMFLDVLDELAERKSDDSSRSQEEKSTAEAVKSTKRDLVSKGDVAAAQSIGRKSINSLSSAELNKLSTFAKKYWSELGIKSPFFRAWFGDWRMSDTTPITVATKIDSTRGLVKNGDTGWEINVSSKVFDETKHQHSPESVQARAYLPYIRDVIKNAVLLDSLGIDPKKSENSLLMHSFYCVADIGKGKEVLKLYVEEMYDPTSKDTNKRAYKLQNIKRTSTVNGGVQGQPPSSLANTVNAIKTISDLFSFVKKYDSEFKPNPASKVVNPDGTPKVMYHGTTSSFTAFDKKKAKSSGLYGRGFYFTESESHAGQYGNAMAVYLDIKNPLEPGKNKVSKEQLRKFLEAVAENEDYDIWNYGTEDISEIVESIYKNDAFAVIQDVNATAIGNFAEALELFNEVNSTNFDGIITPTETVVYEPTQIKSATDNIGTFDKSNPDIRYSTKRDYSYDELVKKPDMSVTIVDSVVPTISNSRVDRKKIKAEAFRNMQGLDLGKNRDGRHYVYVKDIDDYISVNSKAIEHGLSRGITVTAHITPRIGDILKNSIKINELSPRSSDVKQSFLMLGVAADDQGDIYPTRFVVNSYDDGSSSLGEVEVLNSLYSAKAQKNEARRTKYALSNRLKANAHSDFTISIAELLSIVKENYPQILSLDVLNNLGFQSRPDGDLSDEVVYSTKRESSIPEEASEYILDTKEYREILEIADERFELAGRKELSSKAIDRLAGRLLEKSKSNYSRELLTERLTALFDYIANSRDVDWTDVTSLAAEISKDILKQSQTIDRSMRTEFADVLKLMKESKVFISPELKAEIVYNFGSYEAFRKILGNKLKVTVTDTSAVPLDVFWRELSEARPDMFESGVNYLDMPQQLVDFFEMTQPQYVNPYNIEMDMDEAAFDFALQIYEEYFNIPEVKTEAQKYAAKLEMLKGRYNAKIKEIHNTYKERIKSIRCELKAENKKQIAVTREIYRRRNENYRIKRKETQDKQRLRSQIYRLAQGLTDKLVNPTDQKHIPQELISAVNDFCSAITDSGIFSPDRANKLRKVFKNIGENSADPDANLSTMYNEEIADMLEELHDTIAGRRLGELNIEELVRVKNAARYFTHIVVMSNKAFSDNIKERLFDLQSNAISELEKIPPDRKRVRTGIQKGLLKPVTFFELLESPTLMRLYDNIRQGESKWYKTVSSAKKRRQEAATKYDYKSWKNDTIAITPERSDAEIVLTVEEAISIYATANREQGIEHLLLGGIVREEDAKKKFRPKEKSKSVDVRSENIPLTEKDISEIISKLTKEQKSYADDLISYMSSDMASLGNEVSMRLFGIKKFNEKKYFPIRSAINFLYSNPAVENDARIKHMSMTKQLIPKANNPVVIGGFTETVMSHCNDMALYYSFCLPLEDFNRVYNFKTQPTIFERPTSIKQKIDRAYGSKANEYIKRFLTDVNGGVTQQVGADFVNKMISLAKKNAVFASLSVAVQQPSAVARAFLYVDPKYFFSSTFSKRDWNELKKYAPVAGVKEMGYFDTNIGKQSVEWMTEDSYEDLKEKAVALFRDKKYRDDILSFLPSYMDQITWGHIWNAVKKEVAHNNPNMDIKSEEFLKLAGERFTYVIDRTQVYDSVFARAEWMRSKDTGVKVATAFMSEPLTNYNMLYLSAVKASQGDKKFAAKAISAYVVSIAFNSILKSLVTAGRDDDEDKSYWEKYLSNVVANFIEEPFGMIPYLKDFINMVQGYDSNRMDTQVLAELADSAKTLFDDKKSVYQKIKSVISTLGISTGVPYKNLWRDAEMIVKTVDKIFQGDYQATTKEGVVNAIKEEVGVDTPSACEQLVKAFINDDNDHFDKVMGNLRRKHGGDMRQVNSQIRASVKKQYLEGEITRSDAERVLGNLVGDSYDDVYWTLKEWDNPVADGEAFSKYNDFYKAVEDGNGIQSAVNELLNHSVDKKTIAGRITSEFKPQYIELYNSDPTAAKELRKNLLDAYEALGYDRDDKYDDIADWVK